MNQKRVDAYIKPQISISTSIPAQISYDMFFDYNGISADSLHKNEQARGFARHLKYKIRTTSDAFVYTDERGWVKEKDNPNTALCSVRGLKNIVESLAIIISACENLDIQSDLFVHVEDQEFQLVGPADDKEFMRRDTLGMNSKGVSYTALRLLQEAITNLSVEETKTPKM